jgi:hypothetical protein
MTSYYQILGFPILATFALGACGNPEAKKDSIEQFIDGVTANRVGVGGDYWVETNSGAGVNGSEWEKLILVFGFAETESASKACQHVIQGLMGFDGVRTYRCVPAN